MKISHSKRSIDHVMVDSYTSYTAWTPTTNGIVG